MWQVSLDERVGEIVGGADALQITLDGCSIAVPATWLRQACGCAECRTSPLGQRTYELDELLGVVLDSPSPMQAALRESTADGIHVDFVSAEPSTTHAGFVPYGALRLAFGVGRGPISWPQLDSWLFDDAVDADDPAMEARVATRVASLGIALIRGVAVEAGAVLNVAGRLGFVRDTNYGAMFDVRSKPNPDNLAYSSAGLSPHTDNPYRDPCPTVQMLHCLRQAGTGGRSIFVDGFAVADRLRTSRPADFEVLTSTAVAFQYCDDDVDLRSAGPVVETATDGSIRRIRLNNRSMVGPVGVGSADAAAEFFGAYRRFVTDLHDERAAVQYRLAPGDLIVFNNRRVLHGREAFTLSPDDGDRWLQGCYIDLDAVLSTAQLTSATGSKP